MAFYIDSCIYLNVWKKEKKFWKSSEKLLQEIEDNNYKIFYSGFILKELQYKIFPRKLKIKINLFENSENFIKINLSKEEFLLARKLEGKFNFKISFFDIIHIILAKKSNSILITKDKKLMKIANKLNVKTLNPKDY
jgi:predicted nucleic acid-binding protein